MFVDNWKKILFLYVTLVTLEPKPVFFIYSVCVFKVAHSATETQNKTEQ